MRIIDKIALQKLISMILNFIIKLVEICAPKPDGQPDSDKKIWLPRIRRKKQ
jgi:hypothetical protein